MDKINIVQLGAHTGKDHVTDFIYTYRGEIDKILLIEPHPKCIDKLRQNYLSDGVTIHQCAIGTTNGEIDLFYLPSTNLRLSSVINNVHSDFNSEELTSVKVPMLTFDSLFAKHYLNKVDVLFVDVEGIDEDILINYDYQKYNTNFICWEFNHSQRLNGKQHGLLMDKLGNSGFIVEQSGMNKIATRLGTKQYITTLK